jgi:hypothetical protein
MIKVVFDKGIGLDIIVNIDLYENKKKKEYLL